MKTRVFRPPHLILVNSNTVVLTENHTERHTLSTARSIPFGKLPCCFPVQARHGVRRSNTELITVSKVGPSLTKAKRKGKRKTQTQLRWRERSPPNPKTRTRVALKSLKKKKGKYHLSPVLASRLLSIISSILGIVRT